MFLFFKFSGNRKITILESNGIVSFSCEERKSSFEVAISIDFFEFVFKNLSTHHLNVPLEVNSSYICYFCRIFMMVNVNNVNENIWCHLGDRQSVKSVSVNNGANLQKCLALDKNENTLIICIEIYYI